MCIQEKNILPCIMRTHVFGPNFQGKIFHFNFLIQFFIYIQILVFCIIKEFKHLLLNILWYKKFYVPVTNWYYPCIMRTLIFPLKNLDKKVLIHCKIWQYIQDFVLSVVSGNYWGSWDVWGTAVKATVCILSVLVREVHLTISMELRRERLEICLCCADRAHEERTVSPAGPQGQALQPPQRIQRSNGKLI